MNLLSIKFKTLLALTLLVGSVNYLFAQVTYRGKVNDQNQDAVSFANVLLLHSADSSLVAGTISDAEGTFSLEAEHNDYILQIRMIGY